MSDDWVKEALNPENAIERYRPKMNAVIVQLVDYKPVVSIECADDHMLDEISELAKEILALFRGERNIGTF